MYTGVKQVFSNFFDMSRSHREDGDYTDYESMCVYYSEIVRSATTLQQAVDVAHQANNESSTTLRITSSDIWPNRED